MTSTAGTDAGPPSSEEQQQQSSTTAPADSAASSNQQREANNAELEGAILRQVEYYFSRQNLQNDHYLVSKMNPQMYVPLDVVAGFKLLKNLTQDIELIKKVLRSSHKVQLDESGDMVMIRPSVTTAQRTTLILRDIPKGAPEQEIRALFSNSDQIAHIRADIGDTWFITFGDEEQTKTAYDDCQAKLYKGKSVKARIKSENLLKNFLPSQPPVDQPAQAPPMYAPSPYPYPVQPPNPSAMMPPYPYLMTVHPYVAQGAPPFGQPMTGPFPLPDFMQHPAPNMPPMMAPDHGKGGRGGRGGRGGYAAGGGGRGGRQGGGRQPNNNYQGGGGGGNKAQHVQPLQLTPKDFPPLPSASQPLSGYSKGVEFRKYNKEQIIQVLSNLNEGDVPRPAELSPGECPVAATDYNPEIELTRNASNQQQQQQQRESAQQQSSEQQAAQANKSYMEAAKEKSFAEAAITAKDIKPPDKTRRNSQKKANPGYRERGDSSGKKQQQDSADKGGDGGKKGRGRGGRGGGGGRGL